MERQAREEVLWGKCQQESRERKREARRRIEQTQSTKLELKYTSMAAIATGRTKARRRSGRPHKNGGALESAGSDRQWRGQRSSLHR
jgi:hypothetical protein